MYAVTGSTGQLGRLAITALLAKVPPAQIVALARDPAKAADLAARGVSVRAADYARPETLGPALAGVTHLLLISSSEVGQRAPQHRAVIAAAQRAGVKLIVYTSILQASSSPLGLAAEHKETEAVLAASGIPAVILRNGWYTENHAAGIPAALAHGVVLGAAGTGRFSTAARADYAAAAVAALTGDHAGRIYELAGDTAYTLADFAAELSRQTGKSIAYKNLPEADFKAALVGAGFPDGFAHLLADSDAGAAKGALFDDGHALSKLIGRPTTPLAEVVKAALKG